MIFSTKKATLGCGASVDIFFSGLNLQKIINLLLFFLLVICSLISPKLLTGGRIEDVTFFFSEFDFFYYLRGDTHMRRDSFLDSEHASS